MFKKHRVSLFSIRPGAPEQEESAFKLNLETLLDCPEIAGGYACERVMLSTYRHDGNREREKKERLRLGWLCHAKWPHTSAIITMPKEGSLSHYPGSKLSRDS